MATSTSLTGQITFERHNYVTGPYPTAMVVGDFNGDHIPDIAVSNQGDRTVSIFLGNGDGTFNSAGNFATGNVLAIVSADFNGDGIADLATANYNPPTVQIFLGNGEGTFVSGETMPIPGEYPRWVAGLTTGDFRNIGIADLAAGTFPDTVTVMLGNGDGTFTLTALASSVHGNLAAGDFNNDGKLDLAIPGYEYGCIHLGNGDGTFGNCLRLETGNPRTYFAKILDVADFNHDGIRDLLITEDFFSCHGCNDDAVPILLGNGDGTFRRAVGNQAYGNSIGGGAAADFNSLGLLDVAVGSRFCGTDEQCDSGLLLFLGNGDGSVGAPNRFGLGFNPSALVTADFDRDGRPDIAVIGCTGTYGCDKNMLTILLTRSR